MMNLQTLEWEMPQRVDIELCHRTPILQPLIPIPMPIWLTAATNALDAKLENIWKTTTKLGSILTTPKLGQGFDSVAFGFLFFQWSLPALFLVSWSVWCLGIVIQNWNGTKAKSSSMCSPVKTRIWAKFKPTWKNTKNWEFPDSTWKVELQFQRPSIFKSSTITLGAMIASNLS